MLQLAKVTGNFFFTKSNKIKHFGILSTKKEEKNVCQKRSMSDEIIDIILISGLQLFDKYHNLNPIEIKINKNKILADLKSYQKFKV